MIKTDNYQMYHKGEPYTYIVFGPYADNTFDVEVHAGHVRNNNDPGTHVFTHTIERDTHVITDMWDAMDRELG